MNRAPVVVQLDERKFLNREDALVQFLMHVLRTPTYSLKAILGNRQPNECNVFTYPCDVVVDEKRSLLFVSDCGQLNIQVFNLFTKEFLYNIKTTDRPRFMAVYRDSLIFSSEDGFVYRFDLETRSQIWRSSGYSINRDEKMKNPCGVLVDQLRDLIYICECDTDNIHIIHAETGKGNSIIELSRYSRYRNDILAKIITEECKVSRPYGIAFSGDNNHLVVSSVLGAQIHLIDKKGKVVRTFGNFGRQFGSFNFPSSLIVDRNNGNILICDRNNNRIVVLSSRGTFLKAFGNYSANSIDTLYQPRGLCIDHNSGDLYVTNYGHDSICVYSQFN